MFSIHNKLLTLFAVFQLFVFQISAETHAYVAYTSAMSASGMTKELNNELSIIQEEAYNENKFFEVVEISIDGWWGNAYILYNLSDRNGETNSSFVQVASVTALTGSAMANKLQDEINYLQSNAFKENNIISIVDIKLSIDWGFIIYEITK